MYLPSKDYIAATYRQIRDSDPELFEALMRRRRMTEGVNDEPPLTAFEVGEVLESAGDEGPFLQPEERFVLETIVLAKGRPVLKIVDNQPTLEFSEPEDEIWRSRIEEPKDRLYPVIPAVGRIEVNHHANTWLGTGWLLDKRTVVTNRHVASQFAKRGGAGFVFRQGNGNRTMEARIDYLEEFDRSHSLEYEIEQVLWIADFGDSDVAFLKVRLKDTDQPLPEPIKLAATVEKNEFVATIGYPARDHRIPDQELVKSIFGEIFDKKRFAPGQVTHVADGELQHNCSTLGGNSGSAVVRLDTGEAVGLHFAGLFMEANFAVSAPRLRDLHGRLLRGELVERIEVRPPSDSGPSPSGTIASPPSPPDQVLANGGSFTLHLNVPIQITVTMVTPTVVGSPAVPPGGGPGGGLGGPSGPEETLRAAREALAGVPNVTGVRLGYRFKDGWITDERAIVVEMLQGERESLAEGVVPKRFGDLPVEVRSSFPIEGLEGFGVLTEALEAARRGQYREPGHLTLKREKARMKATFHVSPDSGWPNLRDFLGRVKEHLTATIYEWEAPHISEKIKEVMADGDKVLLMVTQRQGTAEAVADMKSALGDAFSHVFASVGSSKLFPTAYHIKVASRDGEEFWLSSGNWKNSNQADIDPAGEGSTSMQPLRKHNREWHAIIANKNLAELFQNYIEFDFKEAQRVPLLEELEASLPDLFVEVLPELEDSRRLDHTPYFKPLHIDEELDVQPLLTPDRDERGVPIFVSAAIAIIKDARRSILVENQSFNLLDENEDEFEAFFRTLVSKQKDGVDVRIIFRDTREFGPANGPKQRRLIEKLKDFGFDTREIKVQPACHTKGIIVDGEVVMLGSHNWTNSGALFNRDASLIVRNKTVATYFQDVFLFDWLNLAHQNLDDRPRRVRIAPSGEATPPGFRRVSIHELLD